MKKKIFFLISFKLTKIHYEKFDIAEFENKYNFEIEVHEIGKFINPSLEKVLKKNFNYKNSKTFNTFTQWKSYIKDALSNQKSNIYVINTIGSQNLNSIRVNYFLKRSKFLKTIEFSKHVHPFYESTPFELGRLIHFIKTILFSFTKVQIYLNSKISNFLQTNLKIFPDYLIKTGDKKEFLKQKKFGVTLLCGNSFDYNLYLKNNINLNIKKSKIGIYLDSPTPIYDNDNLLVGDKRNIFGTPNKWYASLNKFFSYIEKIKDIKILIAPHPKVKYEKKNLIYFYNREFSDQPLVKSAQSSSVIIGRNSAGFSFAAIYKIPAIFVYSDELKDKKNIFMHEQKLYAAEMGLKPFNIDENYSEEKINQLFNFKNDKYQNFSEKYLSSRKDKKINYQIISDLIN